MQFFSNLRHKNSFHQENRTIFTRLLITVIYMYTYPLLRHLNGQLNFTMNHISPFIIINTLTTTRILHDLESCYLPRVGQTLLHTHTNQIAPVHKIKVYQVKKSKDLRFFFYKYTKFICYHLRTITLSTTSK